MFFLYTLNCPYIFTVKADGFVNATVWTSSNFLLDFVIISDIFFSKEDKFLLVDLYSSKIVIG